MHLVDQTRNFACRHRIVAHVGRDDLRGQFYEIAIDRAVTHGWASCRATSRRRKSLNPIDRNKRVSRSSLYFKTTIQFQNPQEKDSCLWRQLLSEYDQHKKK